MDWLYTTDPPAETAMMTEEELVAFVDDLYGRTPLCSVCRIRRATAGSARGECPECFRSRLRSVRLDTSVTPTRTRRRYLDSDALDANLGHDRVDRYWDETDGQGAFHRTSRGTFMHTDHRGETAEVSPRAVEDWLLDGSPEVDPEAINDTAAPLYPHEVKED